MFTRGFARGQQGPRRAWRFASLAHRSPVSHMPRRKRSSLVDIAQTTHEVEALFSLDADTSAILWDHIFTCPPAIFACSGVCKAWRRYVAKSFAGTLLLDGFKHLADTHLTERLGAFSRATALDAHDVQWVDDNFLRLLASGRPPLLPSMQRIDLSGCQSVSSNGVKALVNGLGPRLRGFRQDLTPLHSRCKEMRVTESTIKAIALAPGLEHLSLTLGSAVKKGLEALDGHPRLRTMSLFFEGFTPLWLPSHLPALEELTIKTSSWSGFPWPAMMAHSPFGGLRYPRLQRLVIENAVNENSGGRWLHRSFVEELSRRFPNALVRVVAAGPKSDILPAMCPFQLRGGNLVS